MSRVRLWLSGLTVIALGCGYGVSQYAYFAGTAPEYAKTVDVAPVQYVALATLTVAIAFAFYPERKGEK